jgi:intracellular sulfur oxidation DsrE/DsrF family protein
MTNTSSPTPTDGVSRRGLVARLAAAGAAGLAALRVAPALGASDVPRVVYHLADREKVQFVLGNIDNHIKGMGGPDKVTIALVVHGPALVEFSARGANADLARHIARIGDDGVDLGACGNTLDAQKLTVADLVPGFARIEEGGWCAWRSCRPPAGRMCARDPLARFATRLMGKAVALLVLIAPG